MTSQTHGHAHPERAGGGSGELGAVEFRPPPAPAEPRTPFLRVLEGHASDQLGFLPSESVDCCITSPPYWGLRDYDLPAQVWGGSEFCAHVWSPDGHCYACRAWRGQLGLEPSLNLYLEHLVELFREVRRVLKPTGVLWLNLGDTYNSATNASRRSSEGSVGYWRSAGQMGDRRVRAEGFKVKDLLGIPWRVALALQQDGWYLRSDVVWAKPNPLPEGVKDRPVRSHEYVFLFTRSARYFYDAEAVREPGATERVGGSQRPNDWPGGRKQLSVWTIPTQPYREAHFATFPEQLVERCVKAGSSQRGCCPHCRAPWHRRTRIAYRKVGNRSTNGPRSLERRAQSPGFWVRVEKVVETLGWEPECSCGDPNPAPALVLDPFAGSGTTLAVARRLGRSAIGIELSRPYLRLIRARCGEDGEGGTGAADATSQGLQAEPDPR